MVTWKSITKFVPCFIAWVLLITSTALFFIYPCQYLLTKYNVSIVIFQGVITLFVISNFFLATFMDPGIIPRANVEEDDDDFRAPLFKSVEVHGVQIRMKWCVTCHYYRPPRCSHCSECNTCIDTFDHHCPWVINCIGRRNYRHFFFFLIFLSIHMVSVFIWCFLYILYNQDKIYEKEGIIALGLMLLILLLTIPIIGLTGFHIFLVSRGRTTNEQITGKFQNGFNPFTRGCVLNWCYILCGPRFPRYKLVKKDKDFFLNLEANNLNDVSSTDKVVHVYLDNDEKSIIGSLNKNQFLYSKSNDGMSKTYNENGSTKNSEKIDLVLESISRDCEPSPPASLKSQNLDWQKRSLQNNSQSKLNNFNQFNSYTNYSSPNNLTSSSQSQVLYSQHYPLRNNKLISNNFNQQPKQQIAYEPNEIGLNLISQPGSHLINHPSFYHQFTRSSSPTKSTSIGAISPYAGSDFHSTNTNKQINRSINNTQQSGVVVLHYSPDDLPMITDLDSVGKFASETELQKLKEHLIISDSKQQPTNSTASKSKYFRSNRRPLSFKKALEITEKLDHPLVPNSSTTANSTIKSGSKNSNEGAIDKDDNRRSQYEMNYEISV